MANNDCHELINRIGSICDAALTRLNQPVVKIMNVCGGHERVISKHAIRQLLPEQIELIAGPGCPVCICPEEDIFEAIQLALDHDVILVTYGDMLRVPVNLPVKKIRTLEQAHVQGATVIPIASPQQAVEVARQNPKKQVVFFAIGFETTAAPTAAMIMQGLPDNLSMLTSLRLTWPAVNMLLSSGDAGFDALIAPGHVATIMGAAQWQFVVRDYGITTAVAGFNPETVFAAIYALLSRLGKNRPALDNCYPQAVTATGNAYAQSCLQKVFQVSAANWRGIGSIDQSGYWLQPEYSHYDARLRFALAADLQRKHRGAMPSGCDCARVVLGQIYPDQCRLYGTACIPETPLGPCMVSDEGACRIWWSSQTTSPMRHPVRTNPINKTREVKSQENRIQENRIQENRIPENKIQENKIQENKTQEKIKIQDNKIQESKKQATEKKFTRLNSADRNS